MDTKTYWSAYRSRDPRFDGRFFVAVRTTRIYCRPICPARQAHTHNVCFFSHAAAAEEAGFRPCRRCRPETAPGSPAWTGTSTSVTRALKLIGDGALDGSSVETLARRLGVGGRHLRRLFVRHVGATPLAVARTRRVHFARRLIDETTLAMIDVAASAGFNSVRQFNHDVRATFGRSPSELRRAARGSTSPAGELCLRLPFRPPLDWTRLLGYLNPRALPGIEEVAGATYRRSVAVGRSRGVIAVSAGDDGRHLILKAWLDNPADLLGIVTRARRLFDLDADPASVDTTLSGARGPGNVLRNIEGLRVPGAWDGFELAVRAVLGQQVSVAAATTLAGRLVRRYGEEFETAAGSVHRLFPTPETLAAAELTGLGLPGQRAAAICALARAVSAGELCLDPTADVERNVERLMALPGLGRWTAQYIALRALRDPDAFPEQDLGLRRALATEGRMPTARVLADWSRAWRPWRAYAAMALWWGAAPTTRGAAPAATERNSP